MGGPSLNRLQDLLAVDGIEGVRQVNLNEHPPLARPPPVDRLLQRKTRQETGVLDPNPGLEREEGAGRLEGGPLRHEALTHPSAEALTYGHSLDPVVALAEGDGVGRSQVLGGRL